MLSGVVDVLSVGLYFSRITSLIFRSHMTDATIQTTARAQQLQRHVEDYVAGRLEFVPLLDSLKATGASASEAQDYVDQALAQRGAGVPPSAPTAAQPATSASGPSLGPGPSGHPSTTLGTQPSVSALTPTSSRILPRPSQPQGSPTTLG